MVNFCEGKHGFLEIVSFFQNDLGQAWKFGGIHPAHFGQSHHHGEGIKEFVAKLGEFHGKSIGLFSIFFCLPLLETHDGCITPAVVLCVLVFDQPRAFIASRSQRSFFKRLFQKALPSLAKKFSRLINSIMPSNAIRISGARQHNLRNVTVDIPRHKLVVMTGLSGSGKSSLAFDTLYAEGQRRYVESLSAYARQFLDQMPKPDVDFIEGLSPAIAIEQRTSGANPRSTIATTTEIADYARLLWASAGVPHDPMTGERVEKLSPQQITDRILGLEEGTKIMLLSPVVANEKGEFRDVLEKLTREGFVRARIDGAIIDLGEMKALKLGRDRKHSIEAVVDRLVVREDSRSRLADSVETALRWGGSRLVLLSSTDSERWEEQFFSTAFCNPKTGFTLPELTPQHFSFNSHLGACPACQGLGTELYCDPDLMIPDPSLSLDQGAVAPWRRGTKRMIKFYYTLMRTIAEEHGVSTSVAFSDLPQEFRDYLVNGESAPASGGTSKRARPWEGLVSQMRDLYDRSSSEATRTRIRGYMNRRLCRGCGGARLRPEMLAVTLAGAGGEPKGIHQFAATTVEELCHWMEGVEASGGKLKFLEEVVREIRNRLRFLRDVGLGYLTLDRESGTLSGGEAQRIRLATQIGSGLSGVLYVLDEPSIGLHQRDNDRLLETLRDLRDMGNTVVVVEHDADTILAADHVIDLGPGAGPRGGEIVATGTPADIIAAENSITGQYLSGRSSIPVPKRRVQPRTPAGAHSGWITITGAAENNLKEIDVAVPIGCFTCVTGVSGSGKSTLVDDILRRALFRHFYNAKDRPGRHRSIIGLEQLDKAIVIDQSPIGRSPRSNPATYTGAFGPIRDLFTQLPLARVRGYGPGRFSFNVKGGRCENCTGDGVIRVDMHFLADVFVPCEVCGGRRYNRETLDVTFKGRNIADVLDMTIDEAGQFFRANPAVADKLFALSDVGLGYLRLGQPGNTLSGGEAQRVKLAGELAKRSNGRCVYLLDEPTTGLHFADIHTLLDVLLKLRDAGNTLVVIEHNLDVIKSADWIIDLGPEGGVGGGRVVAEGPPEQVAACGESITGRYLARMV